jgi:hypothetical protein
MRLCSSSMSVLNLNTNILTRYYLFFSIFKISYLGPFILSQKILSRGHYDIILPRLMLVEGLTFKSAIKLVNLIYIDNEFLPIISEISLDQIIPYSKVVYGFTYTALCFISLFLELLLHKYILFRVQNCDLFSTSLYTSLDSSE